MQPSTKAAYFSRLIREDFDLSSMGRFVLGPHWRVASPDEREQFRRRFTDRLVRVYGQRLAQGGEGEFVVTDSRNGPEGIIVSSRIVPAQSAPIALEWWLGITNGVYKSRDVAPPKLAKGL